jgi:hypothetical protein
MLIRLQSPTPAMLETSFRLAAQYGYAIDICPAFGSMREPKAPRVEKPRIESKPPKVQPKAVKTAPKAPKPRPTPTPSTPADPALAALRATGKALRAEAESGAFRLSPKVYGDLRSKDATKLAEAVRIAEGIRFTAIPSGDLGGEKKAAKPKRVPNPSRRIPLSERQKLSASTTPASDDSLKHIAEGNHKALLRDLPLLEEDDSAVMAEIAAIEAAMVEDGDCVDCGATLEECECEELDNDLGELDFEA